MKPNVRPRRMLPDQKLVFNNLGASNPTASDRSDKYRDSSEMELQASSTPHKNNKASFGRAFNTYVVCTELDGECWEIQMVAMKPN